MVPLCDGNNRHMLTYMFLPKMVGRLVNDVLLTNNLNSYIYDGATAAVGLRTSSAR
jgi:hypothetical protein